jgi:hypothetical protein
MPNIAYYDYGYSYVAIPTEAIDPNIHPNPIAAHKLYTSDMNPSKGHILDFLRWSARGGRIANDYVGYRVIVTDLRSGKTVRDVTVSERPNPDIILVENS